MARWDTLRTVVALAALNGWCVYQLDVQSSFLYGVLSEIVFIEQPPGYMKKGAEGKAYKLRKALYYLKHALGVWYSIIDSYFMKEGFLKSPSEHTLYVKKDNNEMFLIVSLYVDGLLFIGNKE